MAKTFRPTFSTRLGNTIVTALLRVGVKMGTMSLLTVRGRKSGQPRTTPVTLVEREGQRWLSSPYGEVNWVRNLRAVGEATLTHGRHRERIIATELSAKEAAVVLKQTMEDRPAMVSMIVGPYFNVTPTSSLEEFEHEAPRHPTFRIEAG